MSPGEDFCPEVEESSSEPFEGIQEEDEAVEEVFESGKGQNSVTEEEEKKEYCPVEKEEDFCYNNDVIATPGEAVPTAGEER